MALVARPGKMGAEGRGYHSPQFLQRRREMECSHHHGHPSQWKDRRCQGVHHLCPALIGQHIQSQGVYRLRDPEEKFLLSFRQALGGGNTAERYASLTAAELAGESPADLEKVLAEGQNSAPIFPGRGCRQSYPGM